MKFNSMIAILLGIVAISGFSFLAYRILNQEGTVKPIQASIAKPWIEVLKPSAFELKKENETIIRELQTGDELEPATVIETNSSGLANIYLPDGSVIRLDSGTKIILEEGNFDNQSEKLVIKIRLSAGRVWSKILELVTPDSLWEVETTNSVAVVRSTAFGLEYVKGKSSIIGSENKIWVSVIDPETKEIIKDREVVISPDKFIEIRDEDIKDIKEDKEFLVALVKDVPKEVLEQEWVKRAKTADAEFNKKIDELRQRGLEGEELRREFRRQILKTFEGKIQERRIENEKIKSIQNEVPADSEIEGRGELKETPEKEMLESKPEETKTAPLAPKPEELVLETKNDLSQVKEGDRIFFEAILVMSDDSWRNITDIAKWQVLGPIGKMERQGVFLAELDLSVVEYGSSSGTVIAVWENPQSGQGLLGKTPIFNVGAKVEEGVEERG